MRPFVLLEVGNARVTPAVTRAMTSFIHEHLRSEGQLGSFTENEPKAVNCVHPLVTLLEKLDALHRRFPNEHTDAAAFVRHYEDAARVIAAIDRLPNLPGFPQVKALADEMLAQKQIARLPSSADATFIPVASPRWDSIRSAHAAIGLMFWGARIDLEDACGTIRAWVRTTFE